MTARLFAASLAAVVGMGAALAPAETSARSGGFAGRPAGFQGGHRAPIVAPFARKIPPAVNKGPVASHHGLAPGHRRAAGFGTGWWGGYGAYYDPSNYVLRYDRPAQSAFPEPRDTVGEPAAITVRVVPAVYDYRLGCQSQTQNVPAAGGGERPITIMRC